MLVVDASVLFEIVADTPAAGAMRARVRQDPDQVAPHLVDAEVLGLIRRHHHEGRLDATASSQAVRDLADWPGERISHQPFLDRAWQLRTTVRSWDALYVAIAEGFGATLVTTDARLAAAEGPRCRIEVLAG